MEPLTKIRNRQLAIASDMLHDIQSLALDAKALNARLVHYRRQILATTFELGEEIAELDADITLPMEILG